MRTSPVLAAATAVLALAAAGCVNSQVRAAREASGSGAAQPSAGMARADLRDLQGALVGTATLQQTPHGVLLTADIANLPPGTHAIHFHAVGRCEAPFATAGGHFNPATRQHGFRSEMGAHAGDLPNIHVPSSGATRIDHIARDVSLGTSGNGLLDADGTAIVVHALADDYRTDPSGASGDRIACGVVAR
jgi:superoxide dismutase, Cu-Zn family